MDKPFLTIDEQIKLLESRGVATDEATPNILMREGYYSIVNGYKVPFLDIKASKLAQDDRYLEGTTFKTLYDLFRFDRNLRELTFKYLIRAEAITRTAISYCFSDAHRSQDDYLLQANYCTKEEFEAYGKDASVYVAELTKLTGILSKHLKSSKTEFVEHYREAHGHVPLWVLANDLTFGNLEHFFNLMKPAEKAAVCKTISAATGRLGDKELGFFSVDKARVSLETLVKFRNICAHDERLYSACVGDRKAINYIKMVWMLERFLTKEEFVVYLNELTEIITRDLKNNIGLQHVYEKLGLDELKAGVKARLEK